jgi:hypothetical protein
MLLSGMGPYVAVVVQAQPQERDAVTVAQENTEEELKAQI